MSHISKFCVRNPQACPNCGKRHKLPPGLVRCEFCGKAHAKRFACNCRIKKKELKFNRIR